MGDDYSPRRYRDSKRPPFSESRYTLKYRMFVDNAQDKLC